MLRRVREPNEKRTYWLCKCDCGNETVVEGGNLRSGHTKSCGCCEKYTLIGDGTVCCLLKNGNKFLFDYEDFPTVAAHKWSVEDSGYVHTTIGGKHIRLHTLLLKVPDGMVIDHINGNRADNRKANLRAASNAENCRNQKLNTRNTTGYKGVFFDNRRNRYSADITFNYKHIFLGYFNDPYEAALAYDRAASFYFGEYARLNFPGKEEERNGCTEILEMAV